MGQSLAEVVNKTFETIREENIINRKLKKELF